MPELVQFRKMCKCSGPKATATMPKFQFKEVKNSGNTITIKIIWHKGPVCDQCGIPWKQAEG